MELSYIQSTQQKLVLSLGMRQSLAALQMALPELRAYVEDQALSNPILELEDPEEPENAPESLSQSRARDIETIFAGDRDFAAFARPDGDWSDSFPAQDGEDFIAQLNDQLIGMEYLTDSMARLCRYLILCLNDRGYFDMDLADFAQACGVTQFQAEQALFIVQSLQPAGVGARSLMECLLLQLMQTPDFNERTIHAVKHGLPLIARGSITELGKLLGCSREEAQRTADIVRALNPIPSGGYGCGQSVIHQISEATIYRRRGALVLELNRSFLPRMSCNSEIIRLLSTGSDPRNPAYLKEKLAQAKQLIACVENRQSTMERLLKAIMARQEGFFLENGPLRPMTMGEIADDLGVNISTVSRAVQDKNIVFDGKSFPLRGFFTAKLPSSDGEVSNQLVRQKLAALIRGEDPTAPLSDERLRQLLERQGLSVSRRTVAKYREQMGIGRASARQKNR